MLIQLSPDARRAVDEMLQQRGFSRSLEELVEIWQASVESLSRRTDLTYDDYSVRVSWRALLDAATEAIPTSEADSILDVIRLADQAFLAATVDDGGRSLSPYFRLDPEKWFWRRIPPSLRVE